MKKLLSIVLFSVILVSVFCATTLAAKDFTNDLIKEGDTVFASFHTTSNFIANNANPTPLEDMCYWLAGNRNELNLKYVSFIGRVSAGSRYYYANYCAALGKTPTELSAASLAREDWNKEFETLANVSSIFYDMEIPYGISICKLDYVGDGYTRSNLQGKYFPADKIIPESYESGIMNDQNYYTVIEDGDKRFIVFQLELWPREHVLDWFNIVMTEHADKYAIIYTTSFIATNGEMFTMWDWAGGFKGEGTTTMRYNNLANDGRPRDGQGIWDYAFSKHNNILAVISSFPYDTNAKQSLEEIVVNKFTNPNGYEVAAVIADTASFPAANGSMAILTKVSEDYKTLTFYYVNSYGKYYDDLTKTVTLNKIGPLADPIIKYEYPKIPAQYNGANKSYILGFDDGTFRPNENMTRAQACTIFARLLLGTNEIPAGYTTRFTDVKAGSWYYNAVAYLDQMNFFNQIEGTTYKPEEPITRAEFVDLANKASSLVGNNKVSFTDVSRDHFYYDAIVAAAQSGLVNGYEDGTFRPDNTITRAEVVTVVNRLTNILDSAKYVDETKVQNTFKDISKHWAKSNILMAANDNVHGAYYYNASVDGVTETNSSIVIANDYMQITIAKNNGKVTEIKNMKNGNIVTGVTDDSTFMYLNDEKGVRNNPSKITIDGNRLKFQFKEAVVYMIVDVHPDFITFEIDSQLPRSMATNLNFARLFVSDNVSTEPDSWGLGCMGMAAHMTHTANGMPHSASSSARADTIYPEGVMGAKLGVVYSQYKDYLTIMQKVADSIDKSVGISSKAGGPYIKTNKGNSLDYGVISSSNPETLKNVIKYAKELGVEQIDFHQGTDTFIQGDFTFANTKNGTAKEFKENQGKMIKDAGLEYTLHTYAYYIDERSTDILSNPKWQKQIEVSEEYTLRKDVTQFRTNFATEEDASGFVCTTGFFFKNMRYALIDEEIIWVYQGTSDGLINVKRGQCGTKAVPHKAGAKIKHLTGYFEMFAPVLGSELFYHIADRTAQAYNDGGFSLIYVDAIDGLAQHLPEDTETWYYYHMFTQRLLSQCETDPIIEFSAAAPQMWNARGRNGAWDTSNRSIKKHIANHIKENKYTMTYNFVTTLGWFNFYPDQNATGGMQNTIQKSLFHDDMDFMGTNAIVYNMTMVYNPFDASSIAENPRLYENITYYNTYYSLLRKSNYFDQSVIDAVKAKMEEGVEFRVIEKTPGKYAFEETYYNFAKLGAALEDSLTFSGKNPYGKQQPMIRIESRWSTLFENPVTLTEFDETKTLGEQNLNKTFANVKMIDNMVTKLKVTGTAKDGDAALISLYGGSGRIDYFVDLNFSGTKEFVFLDHESADYDTTKYTFSDITTTGAAYATYRTDVNYNGIGTCTVRLCGATAKNAKFSTITAYVQTPAPVENPTVKVGSSSITFNTTLNGGEYIEYQPLTKKALVYRADQSVEEVKYTGSLEVGSGNFSATYSCDSKTDAPVRARVVLGFFGPQYSNPAK